MGFIREDFDLYDSILFTLGTTDGSFIASSTPGSRDSLFLQDLFRPGYSDFSDSTSLGKTQFEPGDTSRRIF